MLLKQLFATRTHRMEASEIRELLNRPGLLSFADGNLIG